MPFLCPPITLPHQENLNAAAFQDCVWIAISLASLKLALLQVHDLHGLQMALDLPCTASSCHVPYCAAWLGAKQILLPAAEQAKCFKALQVIVMSAH